jgi:hypothetical protein
MENLSKTVPGADEPIADLSRAPLPTPKVLKARQSLLTQAFKFAGFNIMIMRMVMKGHSSR